MITEIRIRRKDPGFEVEYGATVTYTEYWDAETLVKKLSNYRLLAVTPLPTHDEGNTWCLHTYIKDNAKGSPNE